MMTRNTIKLGRLQSAVLAVVAASGVAYAGTPSVDYSSKGPEPTPPVEDEAFWLCTVLKENTRVKFDNPYIQEFDFTGRYQGQYFWADSNYGDDEGFETRRFRLGAKLKFLKKGEAYFNFNVGTDGGINNDTDFFDTVDSYGIKWKFSDKAKLNIGKHKPKITQEYATSSRKILTLERSAIVNAVTPNKALGISLSGKLDGGFSYNLGFYSGDEGDDDTGKEWGGFDAGWGILASVGYKVNDNTKLRFDYFWQDGDEDNAFFAPYEHIFSFNTTNEWGAFGLDTDIIYAIGQDDSSNPEREQDVWGVVLIPHYDVTDNFQLVGRYQYFGADGEESTRVYSRYYRDRNRRGRLNPPDGGRGENQHSFYLGANYYICDHACKFMAGVEYVTQDTASSDGRDDYSGWNYLVGFRSYW